MSKPELGTKRLCAHRGAKFYDLHHSPITCPKCGRVFGPMEVSSRFRAKAAPDPAPEVEPVMADVPEGQFVSLEEADAEAQREHGESEAPERESVVEPDDQILDDTALIEQSEEEDGALDEITGDDVGIEEGDDVEEAN
jgi:uncharacterized protein (TIGR02300 family)